MVVTPRRASPRRDMVITSSHRHLQSFLRIQLTILLLSFAALVASTPISYFPLNSQLPPVARVLEPFSFTFSPQTFSSDEEMSYALADGSPSWLSLDGASRLLSGTPDETSVPSGETLVGVVIALVASDNTGSTTANATLVVSRNPKPTVRKPLLDQIKNFGPYSAPASILLRPSSQFEFEFDPDTFGINVVGGGNGQNGADRRKRATQDTKREEDGTTAGPGPQLNYYAVSGNNAPLPSWIVFDGENLAFSGKTPGSESLLQPPQRFDFQLVASDVVGFASAAVDFSIVVGSHELTVDEPIINLNATRGEQFEYTDLPNILKLDKRPLEASEVSTIKADGLPEWLSFDERSWKVSGTPDLEAQPTNITIAVVDTFLDDLNVTLSIKLDTKIFVSDLPGLNVSAGDDFSLDLKKFLFAPEDTQLTANTPSGYSWIRFDGLSNILSGTVPKPLDSAFANEIRITFNATQRRTKEKEAKGLNIHVNTIVNTNEPPPAKGPPTKGDDSRRDLYWLLIIPVLLVAVAIILSVFIVRKRRHQPRKLDFSEVSGPVPGTFVANGFMDPSLDEIRKMVDAGPQGPYMRAGGYKPAASLNIQTSQTTLNPSAEADHVPPHAITTYAGASKPAYQDKAMVVVRDSWLASRPARPARPSRPSPTGTDEVSLLSDTSIGQDVPSPETHLLEKRRPVENSYGKKTGLEVPGKAEPSSIQPTPELAYMAAGKYDFVSDDETQPAISSTGRRRSGHQPKPSISIRGAQDRLSKAWKRMSTSKLGDTKRRSHHSASTDVTTCTSILTSGVTEEATTASANVVAKPTVIHISGRPGEARQMSRRTDGSTAFFGGGSLTKSQRNFGLEKDTVQGLAYSTQEDQGQPATPEEQGITRENTWDYLARNSLGIAYRDLVQTKRGPNENWNTDVRAEGLISPSRWPTPGVASSRKGTVDGLQKPPQISPFKLPAKVGLPVTPMSKGKKRVSPTRRLSRIRGSISFSQSPLTHTRGKERSSREERLRLSRIREQKALDEFRVMMSHTPSPHTEWPPSRIRPLPETPSRASRPPLTNHPNQPTGLKNTLSKRSIKTVRSNKSVRSARTGDDDDDDAWEDVLPPESIIFGWEGERSDGSFPVYI
ncbi:hypothetical protein F5X98DRAFT_321387 [Xylaria grammica]|nr:hypothetical protein F5X98DRAFT_321387 [Xylaria grammica]